jgi:hypothetical protein
MKTFPFTKEELMRLSLKCINYPMNPKIFYIYRNCLKENYSPPERNRRTRELARTEFLTSLLEGSLRS